MIGFPLLTALIVLPALGALLVVAIPKTRPELIRVVGFTVAMAVLVIAAYTLYEFATGTPGFQFVSHHV